ncbi:MAG: CPBP family glutamic-type intramembrane protease [Planctomycetota bacterium]
MAILTVVGILALIAVGWMTGSLRFKTSAFAHFPEYLAKALVQQVLLCSFLSLRFQHIFRDRKAVPAACSALVFSSLHLPNFTLVAVTLLAGFFWSYFFLSRGKILPVIVSHAVLGVSISAFLTKPFFASHGAGAVFFRQL